jgi:hypothetical protein
MKMAAKISLLILGTAGISRAAIYFLNYAFEFHRIPLHFTEYLNAAILLSSGLAICSGIALLLDRLFGKKNSNTV